MTDILFCLTELYGDANAKSVFDRVQKLMDKYFLRFEKLKKRRGYRLKRQLDERDAILITYGDQVQDRCSPPLQALTDFCRRYVCNLVSGIHILPFFPYSSDDGFSVVDYRRVNPELGSWEDIARLGQDFRLMFDLVINHISKQSDWFQGFLRGDPGYSNYFIVLGGNPDLSRVVRPRTSPLLTDFKTVSGRKAVWTTFSSDQVDLNYQNPGVLIDMLDVLLSYVDHGADFIRLDAIAYLWKEIGTSCIHHPRTHKLVQLLRLILDQVAPWVMLITETNVPHAENISYFGNGKNEAQLVYNFALPPLVLHTLYSGDCRRLAQWAQSLVLPSDQTTFFNFLASHDGIGINPARGILVDEEINNMVEKAITYGGLVSSRSNSDGSSSPYELNINYFDALSDPNRDETEEIQINRFICAQAIMLAMVGVPGIYFHSLFGSRGWPKGVRKTGQNRTINRQKLEKQILEEELSNPGSRRARIFNHYRQLLKARSSTPAFDPYGSLRVIDCGSSIFGLLRENRTGENQNKCVLCLYNITATCQPLEIDLHMFHLEKGSHSRLIDLKSGKSFPTTENLRLSMQPYQVYWLACV